LIIKKKSVFTNLFLEMVIDIGVSNKLGEFKIVCGSENQTIATGVPKIRGDTAGTKPLKMAQFY